MCINKNDKIKLSLPSNPEYTAICRCTASYIAKNIGYDDGKICLLKQLITSVWMLFLIAKKIDILITVHDDNILKMEFYSDETCETKDNNPMEKLTFKLLEEKAKAFNIEREKGNIKKVCFTL